MASQTPEERDLYNEFRETMYSELAPDNLLEQCLTDEIAGATWRLRRYSAAEADPTDSIDRARAASHSVLHRSINQFRRLQTDRLTRQELLAPNRPPAYMGIADAKHINDALNAFQRGVQAGQQSAASGMTSGMAAELESIMSEPGLPPELNAELLAEAMERERQWNEAHGDSGSFCNPESEGQAATAASASIPRNSPCPCGSGLKYKKCCAQNGPGWPASTMEEVKVAA